MKKLLIGLGILLVSGSLFAGQADKSKLVMPAPDTLKKTVVVDLTVPTSLMNEDAWAPLENALYSLANSDLSSINAVINLHVVGFGGDMIITKNVENAMIAAEKNGIVINAIVDGPAISGHAFLTCAASTVKVQPGGSLTFHHVGGNLVLGFIPIDYKIYPTEPEITNSWDDQLQLCQSKNLLTDADIKAMNSGHRVIYLTDKAGTHKITKTDWDNEWDVLVQAFNFYLFIGFLTLVFRLMYKGIKK